MTDQEITHRPYKKRVFFTLLITYLITLVVLNVVLYYVLTKNEFIDTQDTLKNIAINVSSKIPVEIHERLTLLAQQESDEYKQIESYFQSVMEGNPRIDDIYTMRPITNDPNGMIFVVSGKETIDANNNGEIEEEEEKANLGEYYDVSELPDMRAGLNEPSVDREITYDKWGSWLSGYAPILDESGKSVGLVGVDFQAAIIQHQRRDVLNTMLIIDAIIFPLMLLMSYYLSRRLTRPFEILAFGLEQIVKKNFTYRLPLKSKGDDRIFEDLFNKIRSTFASKRDIDESSQRNKDGNNKII